MPKQSNNGWGGSRPNRSPEARATAVNLTLSREHAKRLRALLPAGGYSKEAATKWLEAQIDRAYEALEPAKDWRGEVL